MKKDLKSKSKRKWIVGGVLLFGGVALLTTGFATWAIGVNQTKQNLGTNVSVQGTVNESVKLTVTPVDGTADAMNASISESHPVQAADEIFYTKDKKATDFKVEYENESQIVKIFKVVVTIFVIIVVFFISYLIISIILKSRNIYYTTLRMLGATSKSTRKILNIELFINSTLSYLMVLTFGYLVKQDIIKIEFIANLIKYITLNECILMYLILFVVTQLIARKFAKKIFKSSAMNRYNEEV